MIVEIKPTQAQKDYAEKLFEESEGEQTIHGYLGKSIVAEYLSCKNNGNKYDYDLLHRGFEVKVFTDKGDSDKGMVPKSLSNQSPFIYVFVRCKKDMSLIWICGWMQRPYFIKQAIYFKGDDTYQLNYTEMESITEF